jgi:O-antigen/teichoic acid export membrane protein
MIQSIITAAAELIIGKQESPTLRNRLFAGASGLLGLRIVFSTVSFLGSILLARLLGNRGFGSYSYAFAWIVLIGVPAIFGMDQLVVRDVAAYCAKQQWSLLHGLLRKATFVVNLASVGLVLLAGVTSWIFFRGHDGSQAWSVFAVALILVPFIALTRVRQSAMQGLHQVAMGAMPEQVIQPGLLLIFLSLAYVSPRIPRTPAVAMGLTVLSVGVAFVVGTVQLYRRLPQEAKSAAPVDPEGILIRSALPLLFVSGAGVLFGQADTLILGALKGPAAVGVYAVAHKAADFISFALNVQGSAFASTATTLYVLRDSDRLQRLITRLARLTLLVSAPLGVGLIFFGRWFLLFYGRQFVEGRMALAILSFSQLLNVAFGAVTMLLVITGFERDAAKATAGGAAANIGFCLLLVPRWGLEGAAIAYTIGMVVWNLWMVLVLYRKAGIHGTVLGPFGRSKQHRRPAEMANLR